MTARSLRPNLTLDDALAETERRYIAANPVSQAGYQRALTALPGGNTRTVLHYSPFPLTMTRGEGARLWDADGHRYTDFLGEFTAGLYGHSHPIILAKVREVLDEGLVLGAPNRYEAALAELLCGRFPSCEQVRFCNSGTEANLMALGAARAFTGRDKVMVFEGGYHGGVLYFAHGGSPVNAPFPYLLGRYNDLEATLDALRPHAGETAAVLVEPMMGSGGGIPGDPEFLHGLREAASEHGIMLIFDEVMTSRLSGGGLQRRLGIIPDLTTLGKYLGGGITFGAFGGRADVLGQFDPRRADALPHAGTFNNNVLTMAAGTVGLTEIFTETAAEELNARGDRLRERLRASAERAGVPAQVTGVGSILCTHFQSTPVARPEDTDHTPAAARALVHLELIERGFITARRGFMSLSVVLEEADCERFADGFDDVLDSCAAVLGARG